MKKRVFCILLALCLLCSALPMVSFAAGQPAYAAVSVQTEPGREELNFNQGWKFVRRYIPEAIQPDYDMEELKRWENVDLPHSVRLEPVYGSASNPTYQGQCMYVKHFPLSEKEQGKKLYIEFEGVMGVTDVWVNGVHMHTKLADHAPAQEGQEANTNYGGYLPFVIDISDVVTFDGSDNVITVLADNRDNGDVPPGKPQSQLDFTYFGGIYRNVWLQVMDPVHITNELYENIEAGGGVFVEYPEVSKERATVSVKTHVRNESAAPKTVLLTSELFDREGNLVGHAEGTQALGADGDFQFLQDIQVDQPHLWNLDDPYLHTLVSTVTVDGVEVDRVETTIGIRKITIDRENGLFINGEAAPLLSGVNRHQDYPVIGNAAPDSLQYRDAVKFKSAGFNVVRSAHYPMSEEFLKACDELGILLFEATPGWQWYPGTETFDTRVRDNIRQMVRRDRNHACILAYEVVLNEAYNVPQNFTRESSLVAKAEHPTGLIATESQGYDVSVNGKDELADFMYGHPESGAMDKSTKALGFVREYGDSYTEDSGDFQGRRISRGLSSQTGEYYPGGEGRMLQQANNRLWDRDNLRGVYPDREESLSQKYRNQEENPAYVGATMWTGIDNRGYGSKMSLTGIWDPYRLPKFAYYAFESQRPVEQNAYLESKGVKTGPSLFIASYWTEQAPVLDKAKYNEPAIGTDEEREIYVYSNADNVTLTVEKDGEVLWSAEHQEPLVNENTKYLPHAPFEFLNVPYTQGSTLKAVGYDENGEEIASQEVTTAGEPAQIKLVADYEGVDFVADGSDMIRVYAYVLDKDGNLCPEAGNKIQFSTSENASIAGDGDKRVGANPVNAEAGIATVYVQSGHDAGEVTVEAGSAGLASGSLTLEMKPMTEKAAAYTEIEQGLGFDSGSMDLVNKEPVVTGDGYENQVDVSIGGESFANSILSNASVLEYDLKGEYSRFTAKAGVSQNNGEPVRFKVYGDGVLLYCSADVTDQTVLEEEIDLDVTGVKTLRLIVENSEKRLMKGAWLSPYIYEGANPPDEGELHDENIAQNKAASASHNSGDAALAVDGNDNTLWVGDSFTAGEEQSLTVDLGEARDIRNARIDLGKDAITYVYDLYTSTDGQNWEPKAHAEKTAWANGTLDYFTAEDVRYIKVVFTSVSSGNAPDIKEIYVYPDKGVDSVTEYNLKGLAIEGKDIVFDPSVTEYTISLKGYETSFTVRALAADEDASIAVNGETVQNPAGISDMADAQPVVVTELDENNNIVVEVTSVSGTGKKQYTVHVDGVFGLEYANYFDTVDCFVPGHNGANGWYYQELNKTTGEWTTIPDNKATYYQGYGFWRGQEDWSRVGPVFIHPGDSYLNSVKTFIAPKDGNVELTSHITSQGGGVKVSVLKNHVQIWPLDSDGLSIKTGPEDISLHVALQQGDALQIMLDADGGNGQDATYMSAAVTYQDAETDPIEELTISGPDTLTAMAGEELAVSYGAAGKTANGDTYYGLPVTWALQEDYEGVTVSEDGTVTISAEAEAGSFVLTAEWEEAGLVAEKTVTLERSSIFYLSDLGWDSETHSSGAPTKNHPVYREGNQMSLNSPDGKLTFEKGIGVDANTTLVFDVEGKNYQTFEAYIGIDTAAPDKDYGGGESIFRIYKDDEVIFESPVMQRDDDCIYVYEDISGAKEIRLEVQINDNPDNPESRYNGWADWADAKFLIEEEAEPIPGDINEDGVLDSEDVDLVKEILLGNLELEESLIPVVDLNGDGKIDVRDLVLMQREVLSA